MGKQPPGLPQRAGQGRPEVQALTSGSAARPEWSSTPHHRPPPAARRPPPGRLIAIPWPAPAHPCGLVPFYHTSKARLRGRPVARRWGPHGGGGSQEGPAPADVTARRKEREQPGGGPGSREAQRSAACGSVIPGLPPSLPSSLWTVSGPREAPPPGPAFLIRGPAPPAPPPPPRRSGAPCVPRGRPSGSGSGSGCRREGALGPEAEGLALIHRTHWAQSGPGASPGPAQPLFQVRCHVSPTQEREKERLYQRRRDAP